VLFPIFLQHNY